MNLRFLCSSSISNDLSDVEFGKKVSITKLYYDKKKLIANGKAQLNEIMKIYNGNACDIKLCLVEVLGFEVAIYEMFLDKKGAYVLKKVQFYVPFVLKIKGIFTLLFYMVTSNIKYDIKDFFKGLSIIRTMIIELSVICNDIMKKPRRRKRTTYDNEPAPISKH